MIDEHEYDLNTIEIEINKLSSFRNSNRQKAINEIGFYLHQKLKSFGYKTIERKFLRSFFDGIKSVTSQNRVYNEVMFYLESNNKIKLTEKIKTQTRFLRNPIYSVYNQKTNQHITNSKFSICKSRNKYKIKAYALI